MPPVATHRHALIAALVTFGVALALPPARAAAPDEARSAAAEMRREFVDSERGAWSGSGGRRVGVLLRVPAQGAAVRRSPLILLSHGAGADAGQLAWLAEALVTRGIAAACVSHVGSAEEELGGALAATDFFPWERARDLSFVLSGLLDDPELRERVDPARIGAAGFSLGGASVIWLGGARLDLEALRRDAPPPVPYLRASIETLAIFAREDPSGRASMARAEQSYHDPRIRAIFALAPAIGFGFTDSSLHAVAVPVSIVVGDADLVAPADANACRYARCIRQSTLTVLPGERGHFIRTSDPKQQAEELAEVGQRAVSFFETVWPSQATGDDASAGQPR